jgi:hypothetical protein
MTHKMKSEKTTPWNAGLFMKREPQHSSLVSFWNGGVWQSNVELPEPYL